MATKIITNISTKQLNQTIDELHQYAQRLAEKCEQFVNELSEQLAKYEKQIVILEDRANELYEVIEICKEDEDQRDLLDKFIFAIGMFNE